MTDMTTTNDDSRLTVLCMQCWIAPEILVETLTPRQREHLADILQERR